MDSIIRISFSDFIVRILLCGFHCVDSVLQVLLCRFYCRFYCVDFYHADSNVHIFIVMWISLCRFDYVDSIVRMPIIQILLCESHCAEFHRVNIYYADFIVIPLCDQIVELHRVIDY